jgi:hypothetical protein
VAVVVRVQQAALTAEVLEALVVMELLIQLQVHPSQEVAVVEDKVLQQVAQAVQVVAVQVK